MNRAQRVLSLASLISLAIVLPIAGAPTEVQDSKQPTPAADPAAEPDLADAKVGIDPVTGELRAVTPEEDAVLRGQMRAFWARFGDIEHKVKKDERTGVHSYVVAPTQMRVAIATIGAGDQLVWDCTSAESDADEFAAGLRAKLAAAQAAREEK